MFFLLLIGFSAILYLKSLSGEFVWDDECFITNNKWIKNPGNAGIFFTPDYWKHHFPGSKGRYRPLRTLSFLVNYSLGGLNPYGYHLLNLIFHTLNCILVFFLARIVIGNYWGVLGAGLIFAAHPINTEAVAWVKNRSEVFALFFFLLSLIMVIKSEDDSFSEIIRGLLYSSAILSYLFALMCKENAITLPLMITVYGALLFSPLKRKNILGKTVPFWIITFLFLAFIFWGINGKEPILKDSPANFFVHLYVIGKTFSVYIFSLFFPFHLHADRSLPLPSSTPITGLLLFGIICFLIIAVIFKQCKSSPVIAFSSLWILFTLSPSANILIISGRLLADQRLYIPSVGFALLVSSFFSLDKGKETLNPLTLIKVGLFSLIIISFALLTWNRIPVWHNDKSLWEDCIKKNPASDRAHYNLGLIYQKQGDFASALKEFSRVLELKPDYFEAHNSLGTTYSHLNQIEKALFHYQKAIELNPNYARAHYNLGNTFVKMGRYDEAIKAYQKAIRLNPDYVDAYSNLGWVYQRKKQLDKAIKTLNLALQLKPDHALANLNLGKVYYKIGNLEMAEKYLRKTLALDPQNGEVHFLLGNIFKARRDLYQAKKFYQEALRLNPQFAEAHNNLGNIFQQEGNLSLAIREYQEAIRIDPSYPEAHNNLANIYSLEKNFSKAREEYQKALTLRPDYFESQFGLASLYFIQGDFDQALVEYQKAAQINHEKALSHLHQALELKLDPNWRKEIARILAFINKKSSPER